MADLLSPTTTVREVFLKATSRGDLVTARHLLAIGADPNWRSSNTWSSLHVAAFNENEELLDLLLDQPAIDVNMKTELQMTPLMMACVCGKTKSVKKLLQIADIAVNSEGRFGGTALHVAACASPLTDTDIVGCVQLLSQDPRVDINHKDKKGNTPLMSCLELARVEMAKILLANPKVEVHTRNKEGKNAEDIAREKNLKEILDMIVARERPMERVRVSSECPVCFEKFTRNSEVYQCTQGHFVCGTCKPRVSVCPTCRGKMMGRCFGFEHYLQDN